MNDGLIRQVKDWAADTTKGPALRDLVQAEASRVIEGMRGEQFAAAAPYTTEELARRVSVYETLAEDLARAAALLTYWAPWTDDRIIPEVVARLANALQRDSGTAAWLDLYLYPAVLVLYAGGLGAVIGRREERLAGLLGAPAVREGRDWKAAALVLSAPAVVDYRLAQQLPGLERHHTPMSDHLCEVMRPWLVDLEVDEVAFERVFDRLEYIHGLVMFDLTRQGDRDGYGAVGRLSWRGKYGDGIDSPLAVEIESAGATWPPLRAGLFGNDATRLAESVKGWNARIAQMRARQF